MKKAFFIFALALLISVAVIAIAITNEDIEKIVCPTCGMEIKAEAEHPRIEGKNGSFHFCGEECREKLTADPTAYMTMEKLKEMQICVDNICTDPECCPKAELEAPVEAPEEAVEDAVEEAVEKTVPPECVDCPGYEKCKDVEKEEPEKEAEEEQQAE